MTPTVEEIVRRLRALPRANVPEVRALRREFSKQIAKAAPRDVLKLALELLPHARWVAYELIFHHRAAMASLGPREIERLARGIDSWGDVDTFACYLSGPAWREKQIPTSLIDKWSRSPDRWYRRAALVSTVRVRDTSRTLRICGKLAADRDDMVYKALSWALRELSKRDPAAVRKFLGEYEGVLHARVLREVRNKLRTGLKNPRKTRFPRS